MKATIPKRDLFFTRYAQIYGKEWKLPESDHKFLFYRINNNLYTKSVFLSTVNYPGAANWNFISDTLVRVPIADKNYVTHMPYSYGFILNPSSWITSSQLKTSEDAEILDICAAPGIKSLNIYLDNFEKGIKLTSVEKDRERYFKMTGLFKDILREDTIEAINIDARSLNSRTLFDKVLCDVPCSAEGEMIIKNDFSKWSSKLINSYTNTEKAILAKAISLTKPGGKIIYSTCTLAPEENEEVVDWALKRFDIELEEINIPPLPDPPKILHGLPGWGIKEYDSSIDKVVRIIPDNIYEGFFIASLRKNKL